jgi:hypothetical protein
MLTPLEYILKACPTLHLGCGCFASGKPITVPAEIPLSLITSLNVTIKERVGKGFNSLSLPV